MSRRLRWFPPAVLVLLLTPAAAVACIWDYDTLLQERARFPSALELITGKFLRHSPEFYQWRIRDRSARLEREPDNPALYDDLAVAYEKTGRHDLAIATMLKKEAKKPGLYETYANLGTFYIHDGQLEKGIEYIDKALATNPDAHFGREKYQKLLVQYVMSRCKDGKLKLPLCREYPDPDHFDPANISFSAFLITPEHLRKQPLSNEERNRAVKGILGMMRFGHHDSPVLLEALGDLLSRQNLDTSDAKQLGARAFLKASYEVTDPDVKREYASKARVALAFQAKAPGVHSQMPLEDLETEFQKELADARAWYEQIHQDEIAWIRDGKNPDEEFAKLYRSDPADVVIVLTDDGRPHDSHEEYERSVSRIVTAFLIGGGVFILICTLLIVWWVIRGARRLR